MPAPAELVVLAAAPLPTVDPLPTAIPQPTVPPTESEAGASPAILPTPELTSEPEPELPAEPPPPLPRQEAQEVQEVQEVRIVTYADLFRAVGDQSGIDWRLLAALAYRESRMDPVALGRDGDMGLMQILPSTWDEFAPQVAAANPFDPRENVQVAAAYLIYLQDFFLGLKTNDLRWVLVAYNWGPERVRRLLAGGGRWEDVPTQQQGYVADILYAAFGPEKPKKSE